MWSQYDEDLSRNAFYKEINENHCDILRKSSEEGWTICVPRSGTINESDIHINTILDHVIVRGAEERYCTLSKKPLQIKDKRIYLENDQTFNASVEILFEETFYTEKARKYTVWCTDRPLFLKRVTCDSHNATVLENLQDCIDFLWAESSGHEVLESIRNLCESFVEDQKEFEMESLQSQKEIVGNLYSQCLQASFKNVILKEKCAKNPVFLENLKVSVENYMQFCVGNKLIYGINTLQHVNDATFNKIVRNSKNVSYKDLEISNELSDVITSAKCQLGKINNYVTVIDKIDCLRKSANTFFQSSQRLCISSDDLLQIFVFLILKLNICNWTANVIFLKEFRLSVLDCSDQSSFFVATLEAAVEFIRSNKFLEVISDNLICSDQNSCSLLELYERVSLGKLNALSDQPKTNLCHPLCNCDNCKTFSSNNNETINEKGQNLLIYATLKNNSRVVEFLLSTDFDINFTDYSGKTPLHYAAENGLQDILLLLITYEADVNCLDNDKNTPLHLACDRGQDNCVKALIYSCAHVEINLGNSQNETPLFLATRWGYFDIVKVLLENGASVCAKNNRNQPAYSLASNNHVLRLFQEFGTERSNNLARECRENVTGVIPYRADAADNCKMHGVRPRNVDEFKKIDLLLKAIENNDLPLTCFYLGFSSGSESKTERDSSRCHPLCDCGDCRKEQDFPDDTAAVTKPININMCDVNGNTPLLVAAKFGRTEVVRLLLDCGAAANTCTYGDLQSPLHLAVRFQRVSVVRELLKCGSCETDPRDSEGNTPLFYACQQNDQKLAELLLTNGADCGKRNNRNRTVLQEAEARNQFRMVKLLRNSLGCGEVKSRLADDALV